jgi:hypothetical protein
MPWLAARFNPDDKPRVVVATPTPLLRVRAKNFLSREKNLRFGKRVLVSGVTRSVWRPRAAFNQTFCRMGAFPWRAPCGKDRLPIAIIECFCVNAGGFF